MDVKRKSRRIWACVFLGIAVGGILFSENSFAGGNNFKDIHADGSSNKGIYADKGSSESFTVAVGEEVKSGQQDRKENGSYDLESFKKDEAGLIDRIKNQYGTVAYYPGEGLNFPAAYMEDGKLAGVVPEMFDFFESVTGIDFEEDTSLSSSWEAEEALEAGDILLAGGIINSRENSEIFGFSDSIYESRLIVIGRIDDEDFSENDIEYDYWGTLIDIEPALSYTVFDERTVAYNSVPELLSAVENGEIRGAIAGQGVLDYADIKEGEKKFKRLTDISIPYSERISYRKEDAELGELLNKLIGIYKLSNPDYMENWNNTMDSYQNELADFYNRAVHLKRQLVITYIITAALLILAMLAAYFAHRKITRLNAEIKTLMLSSDRAESIEADLKERAEIDGLTGLYNKSTYEEKICRVVEHYPDKIGVFAFINLNKFGQINDTYGYAVGDDILVSFGALLKMLTYGRDDTVVFRVGGGEFGAFRGNIGSKEDEEGFYNSLLGLEVKAEAKGKRINVAYSLGVSVYNRDTVALNELVEFAYEAMYKCREKGYDMVVYDGKDGGEG